MKKEEFQQLIGKTIKKIESYKVKGYDDTGNLKITFTDNSFVFIEAGYGNYTGNSEDEYPTKINILPLNFQLFELEPIKNENEEVEI